jgi:hypothetical protein
MHEGLLLAVEEPRGVDGGSYLLQCDPEGGERADERARVLHCL